MNPISAILLLAGVLLVINAVRGTKPASAVLWGKDQSGAPINVRDRVSWAIVGIGLALLGIFQFANRHAN